MATLTPVQTVKRNKVNFTEKAIEPKVAVPKPITANDVLRQNPTLQASDDFKTDEKATGKPVDINPIQTLPQEPEEAPWLVKLAVAAGLPAYQRLFENVTDNSEFVADPDFNPHEAMAEIEGSGFYNLNAQQRRILLNTESRAEFDRFLHHDVDGQNIDNQISDQTGIATTLLGGVLDPMNLVGAAGSGGLSVGARLGLGATLGGAGSAVVYGSTGDEQAAMNVGIGTLAGFAFGRVRVKDRTIISKNGFDDPTPTPIAPALPSPVPPALNNKVPMEVLTSGTSVGNRVLYGEVLDKANDVVVRTQPTAALGDGIDPSWYKQGRLEAPETVQGYGIQRGKTSYRWEHNDDVVDAEPIVKNGDVEGHFTPRGSTPKDGDVHIDTPDGTFTIRGGQKSAKESTKAEAKSEAEEAIQSEAKAESTQNTQSTKPPVDKGTERLSKTYGTISDKFMRWASSADELKWISKFSSKPEYKELLADGLLHNFRNADNVINNASVLSRKGETAIVDMDKAIVKVARSHYGGSWNPLRLRTNMAANRAAEHDLQLTLYRVQAREEAARAAGVKFDIEQAIREVAPNDGIEKLTKRYIDTNFAKHHLEHAKRSGLRGVDDVAESSVYTPMRHSWLKMQQAMVAGKVTREALAKMYGSQLYYRYGDNLAKHIAGASADEQATMMKLGRAFLDTQERLARSSRTHGIAGTNSDELTAMLVNHGMSLKEAERIGVELSQRTADSGKLSNMKRRTRWDLDAVFDDGVGGTMQITDFFDTRLMQHLETYNRAISHRSALAAKGIESESQLREVFDDVLRNMTDPKEIASLQRRVDGFVNSLLGRAVGEEVPNWVKNGQAVASALHLRNSGLYNLMDMVTTAQQLGIANTMRSVAKNISRGLKGSEKIEPDVAESIMQIFTRDIESTGRWRSMITHMEDNHVLGDDAITHGISQTAQTVRYLNMSEYIRRMNIRVIAGIYDDTISRAIKGSLNDTKALKRLGITDDMISRLRSAKSIDDVGAADLFELERAFMTTSDDLVMFAKYGEAPSFFEMSTVGKTIFPYMRYAMVGNQKLLRGTYERDGAVGVGKLLAHQIPMSILLTKARMITSGEDPDIYDSNGEIKMDFVRTALGTLTGGGYLATGLSTALQGGFNSSSTALAPFTSLGRLIQQPFREDATLSDYTKNIPVLGVSVLQMGIGYNQYLENED